MDDAAGATATGRPPAVEAARSSQLIRSWCMYNWASHGWFTPVAAVLAGPWMLALADHAVGDHGILIALGPLRLRAAAFPSAMITVAAVVQLVALPVFGARADARGAKRRWLAAACTAGAVVSGLLAVTSGGAWAAAGVLFVAGSLFAGVSELTWNGMLPELAEPSDRDRVSSLGSAVGYLGGGILLAIDLVVVDLHAELGLTKSVAVRLCFALAALWWLGWGWPSLRRLDTPGRVPVLGALAEAPSRAWTTLRATRRTLNSMPHARRFVLAYLLFADAVSAVLSLASTFLTHELFHNNTTSATPFLFELILMIQFVALGGALLFGRLARRYGAPRALIASLLLWIGLIVYSWAGLTTQLDAVITGFGMGIALGGTGALSRSVFAQMIPLGAEATWFGIYEVCSQGTAWVAPLLFTIVVNTTGSFRQAILSLVVLFVAGTAVLFFVDAGRAAAEAAAVTGPAAPPASRPR